MSGGPLPEPEACDRPCPLSDAYGVSCRARAERVALRGGRSPAIRPKAARAPVAALVPPLRPAWPSDRRGETQRLVACTSQTVLPAKAAEHYQPDACGAQFSCPPPTVNALARAFRLRAWNSAWRQGVRRDGREQGHRPRGRAPALRRGRQRAARRPIARSATRRPRRAAAQPAGGPPPCLRRDRPGRRRAHARGGTRPLRPSRRARQQRGHGELARPRGRPDEDWQAAWERQRDGCHRAMRALVPGMRERGWGRVVNVSSTAGKRPSRNMPEYSVAKAAQLSLSRLYADRCAADGVLVNAICPGPTKSELWIGEGGLAEQSAELSGLAGTEEAIEKAGAGPADRPAGRGRTRSRPRSSSCARSARPTSPAPRGAWTAAPCR